ncbi:glycosyltransferase family 2 protein [Raoultella terrigena]|jgi:amylovoran biosynthesis glycosyltransferase AmsB|uniref:glycosyltransferase family 2 protein n=1 Tax=Raoultella terrigena TaxID=577 RepID=UPI00142F3D6C|nr:glycosyltransferase family 2 protein [Raoultella terrigena]QIT27987.1 glycosyltransferase family 2 protein [Raoultella terrigena]
MEQLKENVKEPFTIVIPNYKRINELIRAIDSIREQENYDSLVHQIIIVDDKSENIEDIENALKIFSDDKIFLVKNSFKSNAAATRNQGARLAQTEWVCLLDSDDAFTNNKLQLLVDKIGSKADVYYNKAIVYFDEKIEDVVPHRPKKPDEKISEYLFVSDEYMQTSTLTIKRSFFEDSGFNEKYIRHQDYDLCLTFDDKKMMVEYADFIGTKIFWNSKERPNEKGESFQYSLNWLEENRYRITEKAYQKFYFKFIVLKSARSGLKKLSIKNFLKLNIKTLHIKQIIIYSIVIIIPSNLQRTLYMMYKKAKINAAKFKSS